MDLASASCQIGVLDQYDGSSLFKFRGCCLLCGIHVAAPVTQQKELVNRCQVIVQLTNLHGHQDLSARSLEELLRNVLESAVSISQYPASMIVVNIHILQYDSKSVIATCVNAVSLALMDSSVALNYIPVAVSTIREDSGAETTVVYAGATDNVVCVYTNDSVSNMLNDPGQEGARQARGIYRMFESKIKLKFSRQLSRSSPAVSNDNTMRRRFPLT